LHLPSHIGAGHGFILWAPKRRNCDSRFRKFSLAKLKSTASDRIVAARNTAENLGNPPSIAPLRPAIFGKE
jgi:hypothetical protein